MLCIVVILCIALIGIAYVALGLWLSLMTITYYITEKNYTPPTDKEMAACRKKVIEGYVGRR